KVTSGGFELASPNVTITRSTMDGNGWQVAAQNNAALNQALTAFVSCVSNLDNVSSLSEAQATIAPGGGMGKVSARCPKGAVIVGGGFTTTGAQQVDASHPDGNGWTVSGRNPTVDPAML